MFILKNNGYQKLAALMLLVAVSTSTTTAYSASVDAAGYSMDTILSASGVVASHPTGHEMFQVVSGPYFAHGVDSNAAQAHPLSSDAFFVPVTLSTFTLE